MSFDLDVDLVLRAIPELMNPPIPLIAVLCATGLACRGAESPREVATQPAHVRLTGCVPFFTAKVVIGGHPFQMLVDSGSTTTAVASYVCATCTDAGVSPLYRPGPHAVDAHRAASTEYGGGAGKGGSGRVIEDSVVVDGFRAAPAA